MPMAALMLARRLALGRLAWLLGVMLAVYIAVEWPLHWLFSDQRNPHAALSTTPYELHISENLRLLSHPVYLLTESVRFVGGCWLLAVLWWGYIKRRLSAGRDPRLGGIADPGRHGARAHRRAPDLHRGSTVVLDRRTAGHKRPAGCRSGTGRQPLVASTALTRPDTRPEPQTPGQPPRLRDRPRP